MVVSFFNVASLLGFLTEFLTWTFLNSHFKIFMQVSHASFILLKILNCKFCTLGFSWKISYNLCPCSISPRLLISSFHANFPTFILSKETRFWKCMLKLDAKKGPTADGESGWWGKARWLPLMGFVLGCVWWKWCRRRENALRRIA